jgi:hypothetical protein
VRTDLRTLCAIASSLFSAVSALVRVIQSYTDKPAWSWLPWEPALRPTPAHGYRVRTTPRGSLQRTCAYKTCLHVA